MRFVYIFLHIITHYTLYTYTIYITHQKHHIHTLCTHTSPTSHRGLSSSSWGYPFSMEAFFGGTSDQHGTGLEKHLPL